MQTSPHMSLAKKAKSNKLVLGFAAVLASAAIGTTGLAAAHAQDNNKPTKEQCAAAGFKNYGQCVAQWAHKQGGGYGGGYGNTMVTTNANTTTTTNTTTNASVRLAVSHASRNVINVVLNLFR